MRLICAGVNIGNICSTRELVKGSPLDVLLIDVLSSAVPPQKLFFRSFSRSICYLSIEFLGSADECEPASLAKCLYIIPLLRLSCQQPNLHLNYVGSINLT